MNRSSRRRAWWLVGVLGALTLGLAARALIYEAIREPPNFAQIEDGLYLGAMVDEPPPGVQAVLNLCEFEDHYSAEVYLHQPVRDGAPAPNLDWLRRQVEFIAAQRRAGRVTFVHCLNGVSRSGMVVTAYLMQKNSWSRDEALAFVRSRRPVVRPHPIFMDLLLEWEQAACRAEEGNSPRADR